MLTTINDNSKEKYSEIHKEELDSFLPHCQKELGFKKPVTINFESDESNSKVLFGKTAYYDPKEMSITIYTSKRHPKDVFRSMAHELVHHCQNCDGQFENMTMEDGYAQDNEHLREMEKDAYLRGNLLLRDFEDQQKMKNKEMRIEQKINQALYEVLTEAVTRSMGNDDMYKDQARAAASKPPRRSSKWRSCKGTLRRGCKGTNVKKVQEELQKLKYLDPGKDDNDGLFGEETEIAIKAFQVDHGISFGDADGVVGKQVAGLLFPIAAHDKVARADIGQAETSAMDSISQLGQDLESHESVPASPTSPGPNGFEPGWDRTNPSGGPAIKPELDRTVNEGKRRVVSEGVDESVPGKAHKMWKNNPKMRGTSPKPIKALDYLERQATKGGLNKRGVKVVKQIMDSLKGKGVDFSKYTALKSLVGLTKANNNRGRDSYQEPLAKKKTANISTKAVSLGKPKVPASPSGGDPGRTGGKESMHNSGENSKKKSKWRRCSTNFKIGCHGKNVKNIQASLLNILGKDALGKEGADGKFGGKTRAAVKDFQKKAGFTGKAVDGIVGDNTIEALSNYKAKTTKKAAPAKKKVTPPTTPPVDSALKGKPGRFDESKDEEDDVVEERHPVGNGPRPVNEHKTFLKSRFTRLLKTERS